MSNIYNNSQKYIGGALYIWDLQKNSAAGTNVIRVI